MLETKNLAVEETAATIATKAYAAQSATSGLAPWDFHRRAMGPHDVLIGIAGARLWNDARDSTAMKLWWVALVINFAWTPVYFGAHLVGAALVVIVALLLTIIAFIRAAWPVDRVSSWLFVPYLAWVSFATLLNASIFALNR